MAMCPHELNGLVVATWIRREDTINPVAFWGARSTELWITVIAVICAKFARNKRNLAKKLNKLSNYGKVAALLQTSARGRPRRVMPLFEAILQTSPASLLTLWNYVLFFFSFFPLMRSVAFPLRRFVAVSAVVTLATGILSLRWISWQHAALLSWPAL